MKKIGLFPPLRNRSAFARIAVCEVGTGMVGTTAASGTCLFRVKW